MSRVALMKILLVTRNYRYWTAFGEWEYQKEIARQADVTFLGVGYPDFKHNMDLQEYVKDRDFDLIYYSQCTTENPGTFKHGSVAACRQPKIGYMHNGHNYQPQQRDRINHWDTSLLLFRAWAGHFQWYRDQVNCPMKFHPQAVNTSMFTPTSEQGLDVAFPGMVIPHYKLRCLMQKRLNTLRNDGLNVWMTWHPGYFYDMDKRYKEFKRRGFLWRQDYADMMAKCKTTLTCGGANKVVVRRYFEAMACGSLLLAPVPNMARTYGFKDGVNMVGVSAEDWEEKLHYYLEHGDERKKIVENALKLVRERHCVTRRVSELLRIFDRVLS